MESFPLEPPQPLPPTIGNKPSRQQSNVPTGGGANAGDTVEGPRAGASREGP